MASWLSIQNSLLMNSIIKRLENICSGHHNFLIFMCHSSSWGIFFSIFFLISVQKHTLWLLIRNASVRHFLWVPITCFSAEIRKEFIWITPVIWSYMWLIFTTPWANSADDKLIFTPPPPPPPPKKKKKKKNRVCSIWSRSILLVNIVSFFFACLFFCLCYYKCLIATK